MNTPTEDLRGLFDDLADALHREGLDPRYGGSARSVSTGPSGADCASEYEGPRRMFAVTVALSEPLDGVELDWPATIASALRLMYGNTTVEILDAWRNDA